jgi:CheY-like chemotaxis protein
MPPTSLAQDRRPLVLLAEDQPESRRRRREMFESFGCIAIAVGSAQAAIRELHQTPLVDLVVTDIHMPSTESDVDDESGVRLAQYVRAHFEHVPIAGYSAYFSESELEIKDWKGFDLAFPKDHSDQSKWSAFDRFYSKGRNSAKALEKQIEECVDLAMKRRDYRVAHQEDELGRLRREYESKLTTLEVRRRLSLDEDKSAVTSAVEGPLGEAGYKLRLVSVASSLDSSELFVVWVSHDGQGAHVEVYAYPELYAQGADEVEALSTLGELMGFFRKEMAQDAREASPRVRALDVFLARVFPDDNTKA